MIILTNAVSEKADEGCLKVAYSLVKRLKAKRTDAFVVSYERSSELTDQYLELNKLLLNRRLISLLRNRKEPVLYIPFPAKTYATALRIFLLSLFVPGELHVVLVMKSQMGRISRLLLRMSGAVFLVFSREAERFYRGFVAKDQVRYLKSGVDTKRFSPVSREKSRELKKKYGFDPERPVVLHVGHLKYGRGIDKLLQLDAQWQILLVTSTLTADEQDSDLRKQIMDRPGSRILDNYIPNIEEVYQLADVYLFPVRQMGNCIDVPLSCLEAAACGKPVVTTTYGEMREFVGKRGFYFSEDMNGEDMNRKVEQAIREQCVDARTAVLEYDWDNAVEELLSL